MDTQVSVQFLGGLADGRNLTGSCILLQIQIAKDKNRFLIDCGLIQGLYKESLERNLAILNQFKPVSINGIILTHAHIDHGGRIPLLTKHGFNGRIYCTKQTANLLPIMLEDNAKIQLSEFIWRNKKMKEASVQPFSSPSRTWMGNYDRAKRKAKSQRQKNPLSEPLYTFDHVKQTYPLIKNGGYEYHEWIKLAKGVDLKFYPSGHVLGGAICVFRIEKRSGFLYLGFSGDLGRDDGVILPPPEIVEEPIDHWFSESTYGGRKHPLREDEIKRLFELVRETANKKGKMILPAFALERTQEVIYILSKAMSEGLIPKIPIFLDSPMAVKITEVFSKGWESPGMFKGQEALGFNPFDPSQNEMLRLVVGQDASSALINSNGPYIVIAGSGMCDAGRVRGHLRKGLTDEKTIVCLIGYMADGSLGRRLKERHSIVNMNKEEVIVKARVVTFESFSAHADSPGLVAYIKKIETNLKSIFIIHGEKKSAVDYKLELIEATKIEGKDIVIPKVGDLFTL